MVIGVFIKYKTVTFLEKKSCQGNQECKNKKKKSFILNSTEAKLFTGFSYRVMKKG